MSNKKSISEKRATMVAAGVMANFWSLLHQEISEWNCEPEDLYLLGEPENPETRQIIRRLAYDVLMVRKVQQAQEARQGGQGKNRLDPTVKSIRTIEPLAKLELEKSGMSGSVLIAQLKKLNQLTEGAEEMLKSSNFQVGPKEKVTIGFYSSELLGFAGLDETILFSAEGAEHVKQFGLGKCLMDDAPYMRMMWTNQPFDNRVYVLHDDVSLMNFKLVHWNRSGPALYGSSSNNKIIVGPHWLIACRIMS